MSIGIGELLIQNIDIYIIIHSMKAQSQSDDIIILAFASKQIIHV